jgi:hypothetical protein
VLIAAQPYGAPARKVSACRTAPSTDATVDIVPYIVAAQDRTVKNEWRRRT